MNREKISVIMSIYKEQENELKESIESILNQTYKNIEFIIIIDYPEEKWREEFVRSYRDNRIKLIVNNKNLGLPQSLNKALKKVTGDYIARMDADDLSSIDRLEKHLNYLKEKQYALCGAYMQCFFEGENQRLVKCPLKPENVAKILKVKNCMSHPTWFAKKEVFQKLDGYRDIFSCEDYDFLIRAVLNGFKIGNINEVLLKNRLTLDSISRGNPGTQELIAVFLRKNYRNKKIISEKEFNDFINSKEYKEKLDSFNKYRKTKNDWERCKNNKFPKYYILGLKLVLNLKHSYREIYKVLYSKYIDFIDKKG